MPYLVAAFYQFIALAAPGKMRDQLAPYCGSLSLRGTILLSPEGINGTLAGSAPNIKDFIRALRTGDVASPAFDRLELKYSTAGEAHFDRLKIRVKPEIITFGRKMDPNRPTGTYVSPADWNDLLEAPDVLLLDTRNGFEVAMGSFAGAIHPGLTSFSQFPDFVAARLDPVKHRKIAMFCTGGIRCEKASAYMLEAGFGEVYQLQGGILKYLEEVPQTRSKWRGDCFVFDRRVALTHGLRINTPKVHANSLDSARPNIAE